MRPRRKAHQATTETMKTYESAYVKLAKAVAPAWAECFEELEGPPPPFNPYMIRRIRENALQHYIPTWVAAASMGFNVDQFEEWCQMGYEDIAAQRKTPYAYLAFHMGRTEAKLIARGLREMREAQGQGWQRHAWFLERVFPRFRVNGSRPCPSVTRTRMNAIEAMAAKFVSLHPDVAKKALPAFIPGEEEVIDHEQHG